MTTTDCPFCGLKRWDADDLTVGDEVCVCDEDDWSDAIPLGTLHRIPDSDGRLPCCGGYALSVAPGEGWTSALGRVDCKGAKRVAALDNAGLLADDNNRKD